MKMDEFKNQISFILGFPSNENIEGLQIEEAVNIAFREIKRYIRTPIDKTVPYAPRMDLENLGIVTRKVINVQASNPRIGLTMSSIDSGNVFQIAAAANVYSAIGNTTSINIDPIMSEMGMAQLRNTLGTDFQWKYDYNNNVLYCAHRDPKPSLVTITYVPDYKDVSEIVNFTWIDYILRMATANMKVALGRTRSKYTIEGSNVSLDGDTLLAEGNEELAKIREELEEKSNKLVVVN